MATDADLHKVEQAIGYPFENKQLLQNALTCPGVDRDNCHGNRLLARLGQAAVRMVITQAGYERSATTEAISDEQDSIDCKARLSLMAEETGIVACIKLCQSSGPPSANVKSHAVRAIIGAVWEDSGRSLATVMGIIQKLKNGHGGLSNPQENINVSDDTSSSPRSTIASSQESMQQACSPHSDFDGSDGQFPDSTNLGLPQATFDLPHNSDDLSTMRMLDLPDENIYINAVDFPVDCIVPDVTQLEHFDEVWKEFSHHTFSNFHIDDSVPCEPGDSISSKSGSSSVSTDGQRGPSSSVELGVPFQLDSNAGKRSRPATGHLGISKRRRLAPGHTWPEWLGTYMSDERNRCKDHNIPGPGDTHLTSEVLSKTMDFGERKGNEMLRILVAICSPSSMIALRTTLRTMRNTSTLREHMPLHGLSALERFKAIETEESYIAESTMLRRCHIWKLWNEHCTSEYISTTPSHEWIMADQPGLRRNSPGNPRNKQRSDAASALMAKIFPDLHRDSSEFKSKSNQIKRLEKLGQRLSMMTDTFGEGFLGLAQCSESDACFLKISDSMFLNPTNDEFRKFLHLLDRTQGDFIRKCSQCIAPILHCIMDGTLKETSLFPLELNQPEQIFEMPKGSQSLLDALNYVE